jgi:hypothetical protein
LITKGKRAREHEGRERRSGAGWRTKEGREPPDELSLCVLEVGRQGLEWFVEIIMGIGLYKCERLAVE